MSTRRPGDIGTRVATSAPEAFRAPEGTRARIEGWISSKSVVGGVIFMVLRDGSGYIQVAGKKSLAGNRVFEAMRDTAIESCVIVEGQVARDSRAPGGKEISVANFEVVAAAESWPITKSAVKSSAFLYDKRHLSIRGRKAQAVMRIRAEIIRATFAFFVKRGFEFISAPILVQNAVEGGATLFKLDYFGEPAYLSQSAQLYEEAAICAFKKVFIFQPAFRAEKSKTSKHLTEFWMIEAEQAFADQEDNMKLQEDLVVQMSEAVVANRGEDLRTLGRSFHVPTKPFPRISYDEVLEMARKKGVSVVWGEDLPTEAEKLMSKRFTTPVFVTDYPLSARSFYHMTKPGNDNVTLSADLFAPEGYGEIATGGQRVHDYQVLLERVKNQELPAKSFDWYLELRKFGLPPHSGFGLGVERTARWICGLKHIRATSLFPRTLTRITP